MARWRVAVDSCSSRSSGVPYAKLIPIQPIPMADTSRVLLPSLRFCMTPSPCDRMGSMGGDRALRGRLAPPLDHWGSSRKSLLHPLSDGAVAQHGSAPGGAKKTPGSARPTALMLV